MRMRQFVSLVAVSLLMAAHARAQQVWIVDAGGQGDFLEIQDAVRAAQDGDAILVHPWPGFGSYAGFEIDGKGVSVSAIEGAFARTGEIAVRNVPAGQAVELTRLIVTVQSGTFAIAVESCAGAVLLSNCRVPFFNGQTLRASEAEDLTLVDTELKGSPALVAFSSLLAVYGGQLEGNSGQGSNIGQAGDGHPGLRLQGSLALLHGTTLRGGAGGETCNGVPGDGGNALELLQWSEAYGVATILQPGIFGIGGCEFICSSCMNGAWGLAVHTDGSSSWHQLGGPARRVTAPTQAHEGTSLSLHIAGANGDQVYLARAGEPAFRFLPHLFGALHLGDGAGLPGIPLGVLPAHGQIAVEVPLPGLAPGVQVERLRTQMIVVDAGGQVALGSPTVVHVLDSGVDSPCVTAIHVRADAPGGGDGKSWATAFDDLQDALAQAEVKRSLCTVGPVEIWVAQGTYTPAPPGGSREARFNVLSGFSLLGGFAGTETSASERDPAAHPTILSGDLLGDDTPGFGNRSDNSYTVVRLFNNSAGKVASIDGFTVRGGHSVGGSSAFHRNGGGVYAGTQASVRGCRIEDNYALDQGGGLFSGGGTSQVWIVSCDFVGNRAGQGGGGAYARISANFLNCLFAENDVESPTGTGGGLLAESVTSSAVVSITNCVFSANRAATGAAARIHLPFNFSGSNLYPVSNTTIVDNEATGDGGSALWVSEGRTMVRNSILWGNTSQGAGGQAAQLSALFPAEVVAHYSCMEGLMDALGPGNISDDPLLDAGLELMPGSPCIDAGNNSLVPFDLLDLDGDLNVTEPLPFDRLGNPRFVDDPDVPDTGAGIPPIVDMGAHERQVPR